jgi:hypothetical protein
MTCTRCKGLIAVVPTEQSGVYEMKCFLCGNRPIPTIAPSVLCREPDCERAAQRGCETCAVCATRIGITHSERIKAGLKERRERVAL